MKENIILKRGVESFAFLYRAFRKGINNEVINKRIINHQNTSKSLPSKDTVRSQYPWKFHTQVFCIHIQPSGNVVRYMMAAFLQAFSCFSLYIQCNNYLHCFSYYK